MARRKDYIPRKNVEFNQWQMNLLNAVEQNYVRWEIPLRAVTPLKKLQMKWAPAYKIASFKAGRTTTDVQIMNSARKEYEKTIRKFTRQWLSFNNLITDAERTGMSIGIQNTKRRKARPPIIELPFISSKPMSGGFIKFSSRRITDETLPSIHPDADAVEIKYKIGTKEEKITSPTDCPESHISTTAKFIFQAGADTPGSWIFYFARWRSFSEHNHNGPWSTIHQMAIA